MVTLTELSPNQETPPDAERSWADLPGRRRRLLCEESPPTLPINTMSATIPHATSKMTVIASMN